MDINVRIANLGWDREPQGLYAPIGYTLAAGGKRLRPRLCMLGANLFDAGCGESEPVVHAALALEIFHNFTLLHDDVMDHSPLRRGRETVWKRWNEQTAILSGDQMMIEAYKELANIGPRYLEPALRVFNRMAQDICEGQQMDMDFETRDDVTEEEYIRMIGGKTSALPAAALQIGAMLAGASDSEQATIYEVGYKIGLAFQIQDDILDVYGDEATFGKPIGGDIREGKKTLMRILAEREGRIESHDVAEVTALYTERGVREQCEERMRAYTGEALRLLAMLPKNAASDELAALASSLLERRL